MSGPTNCQLHLWSPLPGPAPKPSERVTILARDAVMSMFTESSRSQEIRCPSERNLVERRERP